jgi:hypothetical protein
MCSGENRREFYRRLRGGDVMGMSLDQWSDGELECEDGFAVYDCWVCSLQLLGLQLRDG